MTRRRRSWALLVELLRRNRAVLRRAVVGGLGWQVAGIVVPVVIGWTVERGIVQDQRAAIWQGGLVLVALGAVEAGSAAVRHRMASTAYTASTAQLRSELTGAALLLDVDGRASFPSGEVLARETSDAEVIGGFFDAVGHTIAEAVSIPVILLGLAIIDPAIAAVVAGCAIVTAVVIWRSSIVWDRGSARVQDAMGVALEGAQEVVEGAKVLRGIGAERTAVSRFATSSALVRDRVSELGWRWCSFQTSLDVLAALVVAATLLLGGDRVITGDLEVGALVTAIGFVLFLVGPVHTMGERVLTLQTALASADRVVELIDAVPMPTDASVPEVDGGLEVVASDLGITAPGTDRVLLDRAELRVLPAQLVALEGATGAGKSTLLAVLAGLRSPARGTIAIGGSTVDRWPVAALRRRIVLCGPAPFLFSGTVADNLRFADREATDEVLQQALDAAGCGFVPDLPAGLDTELGDRGVSLSGGQRQRLALARAVLASPAVLLLDGATSALDPATEIAVVHGIRHLLPDAAIVIVSTNPAVRDAADVAVRIDDRALVAGAP